MTVVKNSMGGLNSKIKGTQDWTGELEDRMKEITRPENQRKKLKKEWTELQGYLWDSNKRFNICVIKVPRGKRNEQYWKSTWRNNGWKVPKCSKAHKTTDSKSCTNHNQDKLKEMHTQMHHSQTSENKRQRKKSQKQWDRNGSLSVGGKQFSWQIFFIRTYGDQEKEAQHFSGAKRKELST